MESQSTFNPERRIAMLIDGDNAQHSLLKQMFEEASRYGEVTIRRAYGDWTQPNLANWRPVMLAHAIQPIQQWRYTTGKNATDSALIIDAMDILNSGTVQGFCIVSSDSDYTRLCTRIRESGLFVMGIGRMNTPEAFVNACNVFVYVENLPQPDEAKAPEEIKPQPAVKGPGEVKKPEKPKTTAAAKKPVAGNAKTSKKILNLLRRAFDIATQDDEGWVHLGALGNALQRIEPSFDSRTYGFKSLSLLIKSMPDQIIVKGAKKTGTSTIYVRLKEDTP
ncbi:MAG: NYN domain-containing protein [Anaerolineae bacterium]|nr:NYN domain-containing protein [Anaerolineae bacterium]